MSIKIEGYEILEQAGGTTDTTIWTARQISLDRNVSIWVLKNRAAADPNLVNHFSTITRSIARLKHNNFPPVIDISTTPEGIPYIVFENADSVSISRIIKENGIYAVDKALQIAKEVALALDAAWKQTGLVHRNLKPDNLRIFTDGNVKIFNFNSATIVQPGINPLAFDDGMLVGTPNYAAPEQIDCLPSIDFHADMYGLGASLYQMLTGKAPFDEESDPMKILELQRSGYLPNPKVKNPAISDDVVYILARLMAKNPDDRYAWWLDVVEDIERVLTGRPLRMQPPNGIVRSTINQLSLNATPLTISPITPSNQSPIITPIIPGVPVNNAPITPDSYAETVRNAPASENTPPAQTNQPKAQFVKPQVNQPKAPASVPNQSASAPRQSSYKSFVKARPSSVVVLLTRVACILLFLGGVYAIVNMLGPAGSIGAAQPVENEDTPVVPLSQTAVTTNDNVVEKEETAVSTVEDMDPSEFDNFEEDEFVENAASSSDESSVADTTSYATQTVVAESTQTHTSSVTSSANTTSSDASESSPREEMLRKAYAELSTKSIAEARVGVKKIFDEYSSKQGVNRAECRGILNVLGSAIPEAEAVGSTLVKQTQIAFKQITIAGKTIEVKAYAYANGELLCHARKVGSVEIRKISIPLSKATPKEMYDILRTASDASKEMTVTKALLALRNKNHGDFIRHTKNIKALQPFGDFIR